MASGTAPTYNLKNPAVKRILQEIREIEADTSGDFIAEALEVWSSGQEVVGGSLAFSFT
jgi:hypothetical protein